MLTPAIKQDTKAKQMIMTGIAELDKRAMTNPMMSAEPIYNATQVPIKLFVVLYTRIETTVPNIAIMGNSRVSKIDNQPGVL